MQNRAPLLNNWICNDGINASGSVCTHKKQTETDSSLTLFIQMMKPNINTIVKKNKKNKKTNKGKREKQHPSYLHITELG